MNQRGSGLEGEAEFPFTEILNNTLGMAVDDLVTDLVIKEKLIDEFYKVIEEYSTEIAKDIESIVSENDIEKAKKTCDKTFEENMQAMKARAEKEEKEGIKQPKTEGWLLGIKFLVSEKWVNILKSLPHTEQVQTIEEEKPLVKERLAIPLVPDPAEVSFTNSADVASGREALVRRLDAEGKKGYSKTVYFKNIKEARRTGPNAFIFGEYSREKVTEVAKSISSQYESARIALGEMNVADTMVVLGSGAGAPLGSLPEVHVYQESIDSCVGDEIMSDTSSFTGYEELMNAITVLKQKTFSTLDEKNPFEKSVKENIEKHKEALQEYYYALVEAALLGFVPDLQYFNPTGAEEKTTEVIAGPLLNKNAGFWVDEFGKEHIKLFDFGYAFTDLLNEEALMNLKVEIKKRKEQSDYPVYYRCIEKAVNSLEDIDPKTIANELKKSAFSEPFIAPWYRGEFLREAEKSLSSGKIPSGDYVLTVNSSPEKARENAESLLREICSLMNAKYNFKESMIARELKAQRQLTEAQFYGTRVAFIAVGQDRYIITEQEQMFKIEHDDYYKVSGDKLEF